MTIQDKYISEYMSHKVHSKKATVANTPYAHLNK